MGNSINRNTISGVVSLDNLPAELKRKLKTMFVNLLQFGVSHNGQQLENISINLWVSPDRTKFLGGIDAVSESYPYSFFETNEDGAPMFLDLQQASDYRDTHGIDIDQYELLVENFYSLKDLQLYK